MCLFKLHVCGFHVICIFTDLLHCGFYSSSGLHLKKLDKKLERTLLHSYRKVGLPVYMYIA